MVTAAPWRRSDGYLILSHTGVKHHPYANSLTERNFRMRKKKRTYNKSSTQTSNRMPPSVPKCVQRTSDGYRTNYIVTSTPKPMTIAFLFKKVNAGYDVYYSLIDNPTWKRICDDLSFSPVTRSRFGTKSSLAKAIQEVNAWLNMPLPDIR